MGMAYELNIDYLNTKEGRITIAEVVTGGIGGIMAIVFMHPVLSFFCWCTLALSGALVVTNVLNIHQALVVKFPAFLKLEAAYVFLWMGIYIIFMIFSFVSWNLANICVYVEIVLFAIHSGILYITTEHFTFKRELDKVEPSDIESQCYQTFTV